MSNVAAFPKRPSRGRSAVSNGTRMLVTGDNTGKWARRLKDIVALYIEHLGGREQAGVARLSIVRRVATLEVALEGMECAASITPDAMDVDMYQRTANTHRRLVESLGLDPKRPMKDVSLTEYIAAHARGAID